ncbi:MAG TPA: hypothetical protein VK705_08650 [Ferruginibacter sp.]|jgi:hypothetical protein|nr:hypothetical protein [Ferruginibacter sp.]
MTTKQFYQGIKVSLFSVMLLVTFSKARAQEAAFEKGSKTLGLALGVGDGEGSYDYYGDDNHVGLPAFAITYDQGIVGDVGPGTIGVGGIVSAKESWDDYTGGKATWSSFMIGARGDYHLTILKDRNNKFDPYAGVTIGARFNHFHDTGDGYTSNNSEAIFAPFIGAKYNFASHVGVFAEASFDISLLRGGIAFNF